MQKNQNIKRVLLLVLFSFLFVGCASKNSIFSINNRVLTLGKDANSLTSINLTNPVIQRNTSTCVLDSYTLLDRNIEYGDLFIESISLNSDCDWTGLSLGFFESNLRYALRLNNFEVVENIEMSGYNFRTYRINNDSYLNLIYIYSNGEDKFILDYYGRLYDKVIKTFDPQYVNRFFSKKRFIGNYNDSLVRKNFVNHYFERERIEIVPRIGISISL